MPFQAGKDKLVKFTVDGGGEWTIMFQESSWKEAIDKLDVTSSNHSGIQALLAGIFRGEGRVKGVLNSDAGYIPWVAAQGIRAGNKGVMKFYQTTSLFFQVPCLVTDVEYTVQIAGKVEWAGSVSLDAIAGSYAYPS